MNMVKPILFRLMFFSYLFVVALLILGIISLVIPGHTPESVQAQGASPSPRFVTPSAPGSTSNAAYQNINGDVVVSGNIRTSQANQVFTNDAMGIKIVPYSQNYWAIRPFLNAAGGLLVTDNATPNPSPKGYITYDSTGFGLSDSNNVWKVQTKTTGVNLYGNVGIGTDAPAAKLDVAGGPIRALSGGWVNPTGGKGVEIQYDSGGDIGYVYSYDRSNPAYKPMYLDGSKLVLQYSTGGNVGIGTTTPGYKLDVNGAINSNNYIYASNGMRLGELYGNGGLYRPSGIMQFDIGSQNTFRWTYQNNTLMSLDWKDGLNTFDKDINAGRLIVNNPVGYNPALSVTGNANISGNATVGGTVQANYFNAAGTVAIYNSAGEGGTLKLTGSNGTNYHIENLNGVLRGINSPWSSEIWRIDQGGAATFNGGLWAPVFYDSDSPYYKVDPNYSSQLRWLSADGPNNFGTTDFWEDVKLHNEIYSDSWYRVNSTASSNYTGGIYWQSYGGGWYMQDTTWLRTYNQKSIFAGAGEIATNNIQIGGNLYGWPYQPGINEAASVNGSPNLYLTATNNIYLRSTNGFNGGDYAELFKADERLEPGDIVSTGPQTSSIQKSKYGITSTVGVISTKPAMLIDGSGVVFGGPTTINDVNQATDQHEKDSLIKQMQDQQGKYPVALSGRVPVKVSSQGGFIRNGDNIVTSSLPGIGAKASSAGVTVGKAMSQFSPNDQSCSLSSSLESIQWPQMKDTDDQEILTKSCFKLPDGTFVGKIMLFVNTSSFDPDTYLTSTDGYTLTSLLDGSYQLEDKNNNPITRVGAFANLIVSQIKAGVINTEKLIVKGVDVLETLKAQQQTINTLTEQNKLQQQEIDQLKANVEELRKVQTH